jgi:hypothetical protein
VNERLRVLIIGGGGSFGSRIATLLKNDPGLELILAGRNLKKLAELSATLNAQGARTTPLALNLAREDVAHVLAAQRVDLVIHTAGPFQAQNTDVARACMRARVDVIDLADSSSYVSHIRRLDADAKAAGRAIISGASTVPALSSAVVDALSGDFASLTSITTRIAPGNRAPRGRAVVAAILSYVGRTVPGWADGFPIKRIGWSKLHRRSLSIPNVAPLKRRWFAVCEAPDLELFPEHYRGLKTVRFFAGLELTILHLGLWLFSWLPRSRVIRSLRPLTGFFRAVADLFRPFGSDRGGMTVDVEGRTREGVALTRRWTLIAEAGDGPFVPGLAAVIFVRRHLRGDILAPGARPCLSLITLREFEEAMAPLRIKTNIEEMPTPVQQRVLRETYARLPEPIRAMHDVGEAMTARGDAAVRRGRNPIARLAAMIFGFPSTTDHTSVEVTFLPEEGRETWRRRFGSSRFSSTQEYGGPGLLIERFGPIAFSIALRGSEAGIDLIPERAWFGPIPLPRFTVRDISGTERVAEDGRFEFNVRIAFPIIGDIIAYRGRLSPPTPL